MKIGKYIMLGIFALTMIWIIPVKAASFGISASTSEVSPNGTFTVNVGGDAIGRVNLSVSNGSLSTNSVWVEEGYVSVRVTAGASGKVTVTATPAEGFSDSDANIYNPGARSVTVNIKSKTQTPSKPTPNPPTVSKSGNQNLSNITISSGELSPQFNKNKTEYTVNLKADITKIVLKATLEDTKAHMKGAGEINLKPGENEAKIIVTAENGAQKVYTVKMYVDDTPQVYLDYQNEKIGMVRNMKDLSLPEAFSTEEYQIDGKTITVFSKVNMHVVYGINEEDEKALYAFDKDTNQLKYKLTPLKIQDKIFYLTDAKISIEDVFLDNIIINETKVACYKIQNGSEDYCFLNVLRDNGKLTEYLYDSLENTIQRYYNFHSCPTLPKSNFNMMIVFIFGGMFLVSVGIIVFLIIKLKRGGINEKTH